VALFQVLLRFKIFSKEVLKQNYRLRWRKRHCPVLLKPTRAIEMVGGNTVDPQDHMQKDVSRPQLPNRKELIYFF